ncbi:MAG: DnaA ATPase domain-containing protein, partial [Acidimicrobiia bacterium]
MSNVTDFWNKCAASIRDQVSDAVWQSTFADAAPISVTDGVLRLSVPSLIVKEKIEGRYLGLVQDAANEAAETEIEMIIEVRSEATETPGEVTETSDVPAESTETLSVSSGGRTGRATAAPESERDDVLHALNPRYSFGTFVTGASNRFAQAAALSVAETPARSYNPLFIYGDAGLGKTHLLHAIGYYFRENDPSYTVRY